jgi:hypothetical protein
MEADERAEEARRAKEARRRGALLDPRDISFLTNRAAAYLHMGKVSLAQPHPKAPTPSILYPRWRRGG